MIRCTAKSSYLWLPLNKPLKEDPVNNIMCSLLFKQQYKYIQGVAQQQTQLPAVTQLNLQGHITHCAGEGFVVHIDQSQHQSGVPSQKGWINAGWGQVAQTDYSANANNGDMAQNNKSNSSSQFSRAS